MARASRVSEPAAAPAPSAPAPAAPAPAAKSVNRVPEFSAPASPEQPVVMKWDSYDQSDDGGGMPSEPTQLAAKPDAGERATVNVEGTSAEKDVLNPDGDGLAKPGEAPAPETPVEPAAKPKAADRRRVALDALSGERKLRSIETTLATERQERERMERTLRAGTLGEILAARGIAPDDALEQLSLGTYGKQPETAPSVPLPPEVKALRDKVDQLEARDRENTRSAGLAAVQQVVIGIDAAPVVHAAIRAGTVVDYDRKTGRPMNATEIIGQAAASKWRAAGAVEGEQAQFIQEATEALEEILIEQHDPIAQAIAKKRAPAAALSAAAPPAPAARPGITRKTPAAPGAKPAALPFDREARDAEIKKRFGW